MMKWEVRALLALCCLLAAGCPNSAGVTCPNGQQYCNGCISVTNDIHNCGACNKTCSAELACIDGACGCLGKLSNCGDTCIDTNVDGRNCGACGNVCDPGQVCSAGKCATSCTNNLTMCSGTCVDTNSDSINCGTCGTVCGPNNFCVGGQCVFGCPSPLMSCNNDTACFDTNNDGNNCGTCGNVCPMGNICCGGSCVSPDSPQHCGSCAGCPDPVNDTCFDDGGFFCFSMPPG